MTATYRIANVRICVEVNAANEPSKQPDIEVINQFGLPKIINVDVEHQWSLTRRQNKDFYFQIKAGGTLNGKEDDMAPPGLGRENFFKFKIK